MAVIQLQSLCASIVWSRQPSSGRDPLWGCISGQEWLMSGLRPSPMDWPSTLSRDRGCTVAVARANVPEARGCVSDDSIVGDGLICCYETVPCAPHNSQHGSVGTRSHTRSWPPGVRPTNALIWQSAGSGFSSDRGWTKRGGHRVRV